MAAGAVSEREDRFIRIKRLVDLGTEALRKVVDTKLLPPAKLQKKLKELEPSLTNRISRQQRNILYPRGGDPARSCDMDLTLLVFVLRNAVFDKPVSGYGCLPDDNDWSFQADVTRLQFYRNELGHTVYHTLEKHEFRNISHTLTKIIKRFEIQEFPRYDDQITRIITGSLDYRANSFSYHAQFAFRLAPTALYVEVIQPAVKQHKKHPYLCSFCYGTGLSYGADKMRCTYCSLFQQENTVNTSSSKGIPVSDSKVSKTKTERSDSSRSYDEHNFDAINKTKNMRVSQPVIRHSSFNDQRSSCFQTNLSKLQGEMICKSTMNNSLIRSRPTSTPSFLRDQTNSISHTSVQNVSQSDLNQNVTAEKPHEPATMESCNLTCYLNNILFFFFTSLILIELYAYLYNIYKSRLLAALVTAISAVFLYLCLFFLSWYLNKIYILPFFFFTSLILIELYAYLYNIYKSRLLAALVTAISAVFLYLCLFFLIFIFHKINLFGTDGYESFSELVKNTKMTS